MNLEQFLEQRRPHWQTLETLLNRAARDLSRLSAAELDELGQLYRMVTSDLALARRDFPSQQVTRYLNQLAGRAHTVVYGGGPIRRRALVEFYTTRFPQLYRALLPYTTCAFLLFLITSLIAFGVVWYDPDTIYILQGPQIEPLVRQVEQGRLWTDIPPAVRTAASAMILTNNIQVTFITFAGGISAGVFTAWILFINGLHIGGIFGLLQAHGLSAGLAEFVAAHGPVELSVIFAAGGCGLYMGDGLLRPGLLSRREALIRRARTSVLIILGCAPLLVISGIIEGYLSPSDAPWPLKAGVGLVTGVALHLYWLRAGRAEPQSPTVPVSLESGHTLSTARHHDETTSMKTLFYERTAYTLSSEPVPACFLQLDEIFDAHFQERSEFCTHPHVLLAESLCGRMADIEMYAFLMEDTRKRKSLDRSEDDRTAIFTRSFMLGLLQASRGLLDSSAVALAQLCALPLQRAERSFANQDFWHQLILVAPAVHRRYHPMRLFFSEVMRWQSETVYRIPPLLALHAHHGHLPGRDVQLRVVDEQVEDLPILAHEPYAARWIDPLHLYARWKPSQLALCEKICHDLAQGL